MRTTALPVGALLAALVLQTLPAQAVTEAAVRRTCLAALSAQGLRSYRLVDPEVTFSRSGGSFVGRLVRGTDRRDFTCVLDAQGAVTDLVIDPPVGR